MATSIKGPVFGVIGLPKGEKGRSSGAELLDDKLIVAIEQHGARLAWTRASVCPCAPVDEQTKAPDPLCPKCDGYGLFYFGPEDYKPPTDAGTLTPLQKMIVDKSGAAIIRGVIQRVTHAQDLYDVLGNWVRATMLVTVRPENKIGYYDRLVNLDSEVPYSQVIVVEELGSPLELRYPTTGVNTLESTEFRYTQGVDFFVQSGKIIWVPGRAPGIGTRLSAHYLTHPTWLIIDHPHVLRETQRRRKQVKKITNVGNPVALPIQASIRLEYLPARDIPPP